VQGVGAACLLANAAAIITDASRQPRGSALGINTRRRQRHGPSCWCSAACFAPIDWLLCSVISVPPVGLFDTSWAYH